MAIVVPPGYGILSYRFSLAGDSEEMVCTVGLNVQVGLTGPQARCNAKADAWLAAMPGSTMVAGSSFNGCTLRTPDGGVFEAPRTVLGSGGPAALPNNCAYLVKKLSAVAGRRGRGRMYVPPFYVGEGSISQTGDLDGASLVALQNLITAGLPGDDFVILHSQAFGAPAPPAPTPITSFLVDRKIATQRRRLRR